MVNSLLAEALFLVFADGSQRTPGKEPLLAGKVMNRGEEKVRVHMNVAPRSTINTSGGTEN